MKLGKPGWLGDLLAEVAALHHRNKRVTGEVADGARASKRARARSLLRARLREQGLLYGVPDEDVLLVDAPDDVTGLEGHFFLGILRTYARMALDVAEWLEAPEGPRREQLLVLFALLANDIETARAVDGVVRQRKPPSKRLWSRVEDALEHRAQALGGDSVDGLLLYNGVVAVDAQVLGRQAIDYFLRGELSSAGASRRLAAAARRKSLVVDVLTALASADHPPTSPMRRTILRQIDELGLPATLAKPLRARVQRTLEGAPDLAAAIRPAHGEEVRRWLLEQAVLSAMIDGTVSEAEAAFLEKLQAELGLPVSTLAELRAQAGAFYDAHRAVVDALQRAHLAHETSPRLTAVQDALVKNYKRLMQEVRETGELSVLIGKTARGYSPTADERRRMRAQLIDLAKAVPALALFAAPGGLFLLMALAKVLPFSLLPSSFQEPAETAGAGRKP